MCAEKLGAPIFSEKKHNANTKSWNPELNRKRRKGSQNSRDPFHPYSDVFPFVYCIDECGVCSLRSQPSVIVRDLHSECRLYWKLIASVQSEPHHKCHVEVAGSEAAVTAQSALFHLKVGKTHCDRSALHQ